MVEFNELKINQNGNLLIIDVSIKSQDYYTNVYLDKITIDDQVTYIDDGPSTTPLFVQTIDGNQKTYHLELDKVALTKALNNELFFVYVKTKGTPSIDTPCGMDNITTIGVCTYLYPIYQTSMLYMNEVLKTCIIPKNYIDHILKFKALDMAITIGQYTQAIKYFNKFYLTLNTSLPSSNCGCNG